MGAVLGAIQEGCPLASSPSIPGLPPDSFNFLFSICNSAIRFLNEATSFSSAKNPAEGYLIEPPPMLETPIEGLTPPAPGRG